MSLFLAGLALMMAGGAAAIGVRESRASDRLFRLLVVAGAVVTAIAPVGVLAGGAVQPLILHPGMPGGPWELALDSLSAVFALVSLLVGAGCALFGTRYQVGGAKSNALFVTLLAAIVLLVAARSVIPFLIAWEVMAISSYVLIVTDYQAVATRRAGLIYLVATHTATLLLFAMFALWVSPGDWSFQALAQAGPGLPASVRAAVLLLALTGFGVKAGLVPVHFWLPPAHAAAPSHVSALMSGIVIKTGIYGLLRVLLLMGGAPAWYGWLILGIGASSGVLGVLWALAQHDLKRLLAYHSVENIGIILMGTGTGVLGVAFRLPGIAAIGFAGAVLHTVNHALFKSLLFLGAGAVYRATGTREMDQLGGLARRMPLTWLGFAVGATAIIGVPPLNGFVSEWLVFQSLWQSGWSDGPARLAVLGVPALALIGALALACFAKVAGVVFLGHGRTPAARAATEREPGMLAPMLTLAACCVALGFVPTLGLFVAIPVAEQLAAPVEGRVPGAVLAGAGGITLLALAAVAVAGLLWRWRSARFRRRRPRAAETWSCGYPAVTPRMQYTATSFAAPLLAVFGRLSGVEIERSAAGVRTHARDLVLDVMVRPLWNGVRRTAVRLRPIQQGRLYLYLLYVMAALLALLAYLTIALGR